MHVGILFVFFFAGFLTKLIDFFVDIKKEFSFKILLLTIFTATLTSLLMFFSEESSAILLAITLGVFFVGKVDNLFFLLGFSIVSFSGIFLFLENKINLLLFFILLIGSALDEILHELNYRNFPKPLCFILKHRFLMRIFAVLLFLFNSLSLFYLFAFLLWDLGYEIMAKIEKTQLIS